mmetsp:Transcript_104172/g.252844  ORF Transcript_104172/g.252844 Transcript_104172/m.252844 type:complete len:462 (+) Transcript_104172:51-1436(+)
MAGATGEGHFQEVGVTVYPLSGRRLFFHMRRKDTVLQVMENVWTMEGMFPPCCQEIILGNDKLRHREQLQGVCERSQVLRCLSRASGASEKALLPDVRGTGGTAAISLSVIVDPSHHDAAPLCGRLAKLTALARQGYPCVRRALVRGCQHALADVRAASLEAISRCARKGDEQVLALAVARLDDGGHGQLSLGHRRQRHAYPVKEAAVAVLKQVAEIGDECVRAALLAHIQERSRDVRKAVIGALCKLANKGDADVIAKLGQSLQDVCHEVRRSAMDAIVAIGSGGNSVAVCALLSCFADPSPDLRCKALHAISRVAVLDDEQALAAVAQQLLHGRSWVRGLAAQALPFLATPGNRQAVSCLLDRCRDSRGKVRQAAILSLTKLAEANDHTVLLAMAMRLRDWDRRVSFAAARSLRTMLQAVGAKFHVWPSACISAMLNYRLHCSLGTTGCCHCHSSPPTP